MEETYFRMFPLLSEAHESWTAEESLGFSSMFEVFPRLGIQAAVEAYSECIDYRLNPNQALKTFNVPSWNDFFKKKTQTKPILLCPPNSRRAFYCQFSV